MKDIFLFFPVLSVSQSGRQAGRQAGNFFYRNNIVTRGKYLRDQETENHVGGGGGEE